MKARTKKPSRQTSDSFWKRLPPWPVLGAEVCVWALLLLLWWVHDPMLKDAFRLPKLVLGQGLVLASLLLLSWRLRQVETVSLRGVWGVPAVRVVLPLLLAALLSWPFSDYPANVRVAVASLWIGGAAVIGWSAGLPHASLRRLLGGAMISASALAVFGVLQFHGIFRPFDFAGEADAQRIGVTSFAGNAGDLSIFLVLPCVLAQHRLLTERGRRRWLWALGLTLGLYGLAVTQTLSALASLLTGSAVLWWLLLPRRRFLTTVAVGGALLLGALTTVAPLRERVGQKIREMSQGEVNFLLTGRLDGWRAAWWMFQTNPWTGVGHGAYRSEFAHARLELMDEGTEFFEAQRNVMFANAHNEYLEVAAEMGLPGLAALLFGLWNFVTHLRRRGRDPTASSLSWALLAALGVLCLAQFPFRIALTGFQGALFVSWLLAPGEIAQGGQAR